MRTNNYKKRMNFACTFIMGVLLLLFTACNEVMEDSLRYDYPESGSNYESGHVLLIVMDGAAGKAVQAARNAYKTPNLKSMISHALYTDYGLADGSNNIADGAMTNARGWANLMIGNTTHNIKNNNELATGTDNFVTRLIEVQSSVSMYAASDMFRQAFSVEGMTAPVIATDAVVRNSVLEELKRPDTSDLIIAEFEGVNEAAGGHYYNENGTPADAVVNAIGILDGYIGDMWNALKERPGFTRENWLIIVTSNYGGEVQLEEGKNLADHYEDATRNTFTLMYNERLVSQVQVTPGNTALTYSFFTPVYSYDNRYPDPATYAESARLRNTELGEFYFNDNNEISPVTVQYFLKSSVYNSQKFVILSKSANMDENSKVANGWFFHFNQDTSNRRICFGFGGKRAVLQTKDESNLDWSLWHVVTLTMEPNPDPKKKTETLVTIYLDGEQNNQTSVKNSDLVKGYTQNSSFTSKDAPLRIGGTENRDSQNSQRNTKGQQAKNFIYLTNLQIYDVAIPKEDIALFAGKNQLHVLKESYKYWDNLKGYWPCDLEEDQMEPIMKNYAKDSKDDTTDDFEIDRGASDIWLSGNSLSAGIHPIPESDKTFYSKTFNTVDISRQIFMWLGKSVKWDWEMEGKAWKFTYEEFSNKNN